MKKIIVSITLSVALLATTLLPNSLSFFTTKAADVVDQNKEATVEMTICDSSFEDLRRNQYHFLDEDGYFYFYSNLHPWGYKGDLFQESLVINPYEECDISSVPIEYYNGESWVDARSAYVNNSHALQTTTTGDGHGPSDYVTYFRMKFTSSSSAAFTIKYEANYDYTEAQEGESVPQKTVESSVKHIKVGKGQVMMTHNLNGEMSNDPTEAPTESQSVEPTTTQDTTTTQDVTTTQGTTTTTVPVTGEESTTSTADVTTTKANGQDVKAPGKVTIKKIWKKKRSAKKLKVKVKAVKGAKGYEISVYKNKKTAKKGIKALVVKYTTKLKYTIKSKKIKKKKKLFVGARAYALAADGTKVFGPYSKIKKVKIK